MGTILETETISPHSVRSEMFLWVNTKLRWQVVDFAYGGGRVQGLRSCVARQTCPNPQGTEELWH